MCGLFVSRRVLAAEKSEFGVCGGVGGMMVIELLAGKMRRGRGRIAVVEDDMRQAYIVKHIRKSLTLLGYGAWAAAGELLCHSYCVRGV